MAGRSWGRARNRAHRGAEDRGRRDRRRRKRLRLGRDPEFHPVPRVTRAATHRETSSASRSRRSPTHCSCALRRPGRVDQRPLVLARHRLHAGALCGDVAVDQALASADVTALRSPSRQPGRSLRGHRQHHPPPQAGHADGGFRHRPSLPRGTGLLSRSKAWWISSSLLGFSAPRKK